MNDALFLEWLRAPSELIAESLLEANRTTDVDAVLRHRDNVIVPALDKLAAMTCVLIERNLTELTERAASELYGVYEMPEELHVRSLPQRQLHFGPSYIWHQVIVRVYVAGALAFRREAFQL